MTRRAQKAIRHTLFPTVFTLPVRMTAYLRTTYLPDPASGTMKTGSAVSSISCRVCSTWGSGRHDWEIQDNATRMATPGNIIPLGGLHEEGGNDSTWRRKNCARKREVSWRYLNSGVKNAIKVLIGFIPAFLTFALTKDWWLLAYGGAFIWFGITGLRNILQSVLGGGGIRRSPLLRWNDYVSWGRLTDSLLFTGFSVPLLDYIVKTVLLDRMFGVTTATNPIAPLYRHGPGQRPLPLQPQRLPGASEGGDLRELLPERPVDPARHRLQCGDRRHPLRSGCPGDQRRPAEVGGGDLQGGLRLRRRRHRRPRRPV